MFFVDFVVMVGVCVMFVVGWIIDDFDILLFVVFIFFIDFVGLVEVVFIEFLCWLCEVGVVLVCVMKF